MTRLLVLSPPLPHLHHHQPVALPLLLPLQSHQRVAHRDAPRRQLSRHPQQVLQPASQPPQLQLSAVQYPPYLQPQMQQMHSHPSEMLRPLPPSQQHAHLPVLLMGLLPLTLPLAASVEAAVEALAQAPVLELV